MGINNKLKANRYPQRISIYLISIFLLLVIIPSIPYASAGGQDAEFDSINTMAIPPMQGLGGEILIEATADFYGGCCYHLFARDVKAELVVPENVRIVSQPPDLISEVDAAPGGKATSVKFKWTVVGDVPGEYELEAIISSSNCGKESELFQISIVEGVSISNAQIHPIKPSMNEAITFMADVRSGNELVAIKQANLYIWRSTEKYRSIDLNAEKDLLYKIIESVKESPTNTSDDQTNQTGDTSDNVKKAQLLGQGTRYTMTPSQFTETWRIRLDDFKSEENIYYWFNVETSDGKNVSSFIYKQTIEDLEKKFQRVDISIWSTFTVIIIGVILILGISWSVFGRSVKDIGNSGVFFLGSSTYAKPMEGTRANLSVMSIEKFRIIIFLIILIIMIILIIISFYQGLFDALITETGE